MITSGARCALEVRELPLHKQSSTRRMLKCFDDGV
jgi:hypothetical protein